MAEKVMDEQGGFRAGRGCNDQIFAVRQIMEKTSLVPRLSKLISAGERAAWESLFAHAQRFFSK